ncbi:MAG: glycosyltransferase [Breoghania sp.]|nr:glycosyltransferase [Breoghania sp.]
MNRAVRRMPRGNFVKVGRLGGYYPLKYYKKCDWLIANTPDLERYIKDGDWPADRVRMLTNFGELEPMPPTSRASLDTPEDAFVLLSMGRLHVSKGFDTLIDAVTKVEGAYLWLAGTGELEAPLKAQAEAAGITDRIRFLGWRDDQAALLQSADICVVPIALIKMDIEGMEYRVINALLDAGVMDQINMVYVEDHCNRIPDLSVQRDSTLAKIEKLGLTEKINFDWP